MLAVEDDPTFASAHLLVGAALHSLGRTDGKGVSPFERAVIGSKALQPGPERDLILGMSKRAIGNCLQADAALQAVEEAAPEWYAAHLDWELADRADALRCAGRNDQAKAHLLVLAENDDTAALAALVAHFLAIDGDVVAARRAVRRSIRLGDGVLRPEIVLFDAIEHLSNDDFDAARSALTAVLGGPTGVDSGTGSASPVLDAARTAGGADVLIRARLLLANVELRAGDKAAAARQLDYASAEARSSERPTWRAEIDIQRAVLDGSEGGAGRERAFLGAREATSMDAADVRLSLRGALLTALSGERMQSDTTESIDLLPDVKERRAFDALLQGAEALAANDPNLAIELFAASLDMGPMTIRAGAPSSWRRSVSEALLADAYASAGDDTAALTIRRRLASRNVQVAHAGSILETLIWMDARESINRR